MIRTSDQFVNSCIQDGGTLAAGISCYAGKLGPGNLDFGARIPIDHQLGFIAAGASSLYTW